MLLTDEHLKQSAQMIPDMGIALSKLPKPTSAPANRVEALRAASDAYDNFIVSKIGPTPSHLTETYHSIPLRDGTSSTIKITKPASSPPGPLIVLMFSGAFIAGSVEQLSQIARALSTLYAATTVCINYRLAPEHAFPTAVHDAIDSVIWVSEHATEPLLNSDPTLGFILGGASSGGNLAAVLSRYFQAPDRALKYPVTGQWLGIANLMTEVTCPEQYRSYFQSLAQNANAPILNAQALASGSMALRDDPTSELRFPVNSTTDIGGQPKTYIQVCGMDPLRDDGLVYDEMLKRAGVETKVDLYEGCPHGFWLVVPGEEIAVRAVVDIVVGLGWLLGKEAGRVEAEKVL